MRKDTKDLGDFRTEKGVYSLEDFALWSQNGVLEITPKFQRRGVWQNGEKSLLIDTMLRGMTVPPLYMRSNQNKEKTKSIREVVDGQQRVRTVLEFVTDDGFRLSSTLQGPWAGKRFHELSREDQLTVRQFGFSVEIFKGISDQQVFEIFGRLNMNGVPLNKQEIRNGKFFGRFKQLSFSLALEHLEFWRRNRVFTEQSIARMMEVELTSELLVAGLDGMQDKKKSIDTFYESLDAKFPSEETYRKRFCETISTIADTVGDDLKSTAFRRPPLFYTLYCVAYHHMYGLPGVQRKSPKSKLSSDARQGLKQALLRFSDMIAASKDPEQDIPKRFAVFIASSARQTDNINPRKVRFDELYNEAF